MLYGYTIADAANHDVFMEAVDFITNDLHFNPTSNASVDVDGSIRQSFSNGVSNLTLESDSLVDYIAILSDSALPIQCLKKWTQ